MSELEQLLQQKKELELRIKELKNSATVIGTAKLDIEHYPTNIPDRHYVSVLYHPYDGFDRPLTTKSTWRCITCGKTRKEAIEKLPEIIKDLTELYNRCKEEE